MSLAKGKRTAEWLNIGINKPIIIMIIIYWAPSLHQMQSWIPYMCFFNPYNTPGDRHNYLYFTEVCLLSQWLISAITIEYQVHHPKWWHELRGLQARFTQFRNFSSFFQFSGQHLLPPLFIQQMFIEHILCQAGTRHWVDGCEQSSQSSCPPGACLLGWSLNFYKNMVRKKQQN